MTVVVASAASRGALKQHFTLKIRRENKYHLEVNSLVAVSKKPFASVSQLIVTPG